MPDRAMLTLIIIAFGERWLVVPSRAGTEVIVPGRAIIKVGLVSLSQMVQSCCCGTTPYVRE